MKTIETPALSEVHALTPHRYQIFRQANNGCHFNHGSSIASAKEAVEISLKPLLHLRAVIFAFGITANNVPWCRPRGSSRLLVSVSGVRTRKRFL